MRKVICVAGTHAGIPSWIEDPDHPFQQRLKEHNLELARVNGLPFRWHTKLGGLWWHGEEIWSEPADELCEFASNFDYDDLNFIGHSHGGNVIIIAAAKLTGIRRVRTITTVGTPHRNNLPNDVAAQNTEFWQHVFDQKMDFIATLRKRLGAVGDGEISLERMFRYDGVLNVPLLDIGHSRLLSGDITDPAIDLWDTRCLLQNIAAGLPGDR